MQSNKKEKTEGFLVEVIGTVFDEEVQHDNSDLPEVRRGANEHNADYIPANLQEGLHLLRLVMDW